MFYRFENSWIQYLFCIIPLLNLLYCYIPFYILLLDKKSICFDRFHLVSFQMYYSILLVEGLLIIFEAFVWVLKFWETYKGSKTLLSDASATRAARASILELSIPSVDCNGIILLSKALRSFLYHQKVHLCFQ